MAIRTILDISTDHLPARFLDANVVTLTGGGHLETGLLLWVPPPGGCTGSGGTKDDNAPEVVRLREYARGLGADYVLLDRDAPHDMDLPVFDGVHLDPDVIESDFADRMSVAEAAVHASREYGEDWMVTVDADEAAVAGLASTSYRVLVADRLDYEAA